MLLTKASHSCKTIPQIKNSLCSDSLIHGSFATLLTPSSANIYFHCLFITHLIFTIKKRDRSPAFEYLLFYDYSIIFVTTPDPTVRPPSLIANLSPSSIAIGVMRLIVIWMLSPGITISTPSGNCKSPVTSVVLK